MGRRLLGVAVTTLSLAVVPAAGAVPGAPVLGPQRVLVALVTWAPTPFAPAEVADVLGKVDAFYRKQSFGKASLTVTVTPWLNAFDAPPACAANALRDAGARAARAAGYDPAAYDVVVYLHPDLGCPWSGATYAGVVFLDGELTTYLVAHELGHAFGLPHANTTTCFRHSCVALEYGDPYDTMGSGNGDFSAYAKAGLGWITHVMRVARGGTYTLAALERESAAAQALVVTTAQDQYWLEYRTEPAAKAGAGVLVHVSPSPDVRSPVTGNSYNTLVSDPGKRGRPDLLPGDTFTYPAVFRLTVVRSSGADARLRFKWIDRTPPSAPRVTSSVVGGRIEVTVDRAREVGSGIAHYDVSLDGRAPLSFGTDINDEPVRIGHPLPGTHTVHVVAVDRAGNRSAPAVRQVRVP